MVDCKNWELDNGHCYYCTEHNKQDCEFYKPKDDMPTDIEKLKSAIIVIKETVHDYSIIDLKPQGGLMLLIL